MRLEYLTRKKSIEDYYDKSINDLIKDLYLHKQMSSNEISEKINKDVGTKITGRAILDFIKSQGIQRNLGSALRLAIKTGRKNYDKLRKPIKTKEYRKGINLKVRYSVLKRDNFRCVLCGRTAKDDSLVIDHIIPVVKGGVNVVNNLRTLCRACNHGKMIYENEK